MITCPLIICVLLQGIRSPPPSIYYRVLKIGVSSVNLNKTYNYSSTSFLYPYIFLDYHLWIITLDYLLWIITFGLSLLVICYIVLLDVKILCCEISELYIAATPQSLSLFLFCFSYFYWRYNPHCKSFFLILLPRTYLIGSVSFAFPLLFSFLGWQMWDLYSFLCCIIVFMLLW